MSGTCSMDRRTVPVRGTNHLRNLGKAEDRSSLREKVTNAGTVVNLCILYNQRDATYTVFFFIISALHVSGGFFRPSSGAYKTVCAALGIVMFSCCLPLVWTGWNCSNPSTPAVDSRKT